MLKKIGFPMLGLAAMLMLAPLPKASAGVRAGVVVGGPAYAYPSYPDPYAYPYSYPNYYAYPAYPYSAPSYVYPYGGYWRDHDRHEYRERREHEWREHERHEHEGRGRGYRR